MQTRNSSERQGSETIKGPGLRIDLDLRRVWQCPACGLKQKAPYTEATKRCRCRDERPWMKLIDEPFVPREFDVAISYAVASMTDDVAEDGPDEGAEVVAVESAESVESGEEQSVSSVSTAAETVAESPAETALPPEDAPVTATHGTADAETSSAAGEAESPPAAEATTDVDSDTPAGAEQAEPDSTRAAAATDTGDAPAGNAAGETTGKGGTDETGGKAEGKKGRRRRRRRRRKK